MKQIYTGIIVVLLIAVTVCWVGMGIYDALTTSEVDPNAQSYIKPIKENFDTESLDELEKRVEDLPVSPDVFHEIEADAVKANSADETPVDTTEDTATQ